MKNIYPQFLMNNYLQGAGHPHHCRYRRRYRYRRRRRLHHILLTQKFLRDHFQHPEMEKIPPTTPILITFSFFPEKREENKG